MREVASLASSYRHRELPTSLIQRIELMQHYARAAQAQAEGLPPPIESAPPIPSRRSQAVILAWFSLGVLASGALGAGSIVGMRAAAVGEMPLLSWSAWAKTPQARPVPQQDGKWDTIEVAIDRRARAHAPLPLEVTGAEGAAIQVIMQGLPPGVTPSVGQRLGQSTWMVSRADLDALFLRLDDTAPDVFDMKIGLALSPGGIVPASIVQVRLVDVAEQKQASATGDAGVLSDAPETRLVESGAAHDTDTARTTAARASEKQAAPTAQKRVVTAADVSGLPPAAGRSWPEGASGLGAVPHETGRPSWWQSGQLSWWQMPPPSWSPFLVGQERP